MALDSTTLLFASISARLAYIVVMGIWWRRQRSEPFLLHWCLSIGISSAGLVYHAGTGGGATSQPDLAAYLLFGASNALCWSGLRLFNERPLDRRRLVGLALLPALAYGAALGLGQRAAMVAAFAALAVQIAVTLAELLRDGAIARLWSSAVVAAGFGTYLVIFLASMALLAVEPAAMAANRGADLSLVIDQSCSALVYLGFLAMAGERASLRLAHLAGTDPLTGLANRRGLSQLAHGRARPAAILLADIDHFKAINDGHGHEGGDAVLVEFARRLRGSLRARDIAARWGGEEFLVVLHGADPAMAEALAERVRAATEAHPFRVGQDPIRITVSIGVAILREDEHGIEPALQRADAALYAAKSDGRNRVRAASPAAPAVSAGSGGFP
ncbi:GGDEF domain-containing protein [Methylobacterium sp. WSM2598]|uniref:GGDEF domain-containing protein n=1 Tax=Methylobacterium sp. WSM2598 TaxID=398261 RepID=UPI000380F5C6|nr:GGDEF domain-containing protein [Methylobacterium sp. WSM2598]